MTKVTLAITARGYSRYLVVVKEENSCISLKNSSPTKISPRHTLVTQVCTPSLELC